MRTSWSVRSLVFSLAAGALMGLCVSALKGFAKSEGDQPATAGPKPGVGETVLVPKKTPPAPPAQGGEKKPEKVNPKEIFTLSTATNLVNVEVIVLDRNGNPLPGLGKSNFRVLDDGVPQTISNFASVEAPMTICML